MERRIKFCGECAAWRDGWCVVHDDRAGRLDRVCSRIEVGLRITKTEIEAAERRMRRCLEHV